MGGIYWQPQEDATYIHEAWSIHPKALMQMMVAFRRIVSGKVRFHVSPSNTEMQRLIGLLGAEVVSVLWEISL